MIKSSPSVFLRFLASLAFMTLIVLLVLPGALAQSTGPKIWLGESQQLAVNYAGPKTPAGTDLSGAQPVSMVQGDFDRDGINDLAVGFSAPGGSFIAIHRGNLDAFAPQSNASFQAIARGQFPSPFLATVKTFAVPISPDFIAAGDFTGRGNTDLAVASRGGNALYVLPGNGKGNFAAPQIVNLSGGVTALAAGDFGRAYQRTLIVGVSGPETNALLVYGATPQGLQQLAGFSLSTPASSIDFANFGGAGRDAAFLAGGQVYILRSSPMQIVPVSLPASVSAFALGSFIYDRSGGTQIALLASDGSIQIAARNEFDPRVYTTAEFGVIRQAKVNHLPPPASLVPAQFFPTGWKVVESFPGVGTVAAAQAPLFFRTRVSSNGADDLMWLGASSGRMVVISHPNAQPGAQTFLPGQVSVRPYNGSPVSALPMRTNVDGRPGVISLHQGEMAPSVLMPLPDPTFTVNTTSDGVFPGACALATPNQCTLREAILEANGDTIMVPVGTYNLTIGRGVTQDYSGNTGALYVNHTATIVGADQNTTIIQWGTPGSGTVDMVMAVNEDINPTDATASLSNLTIQNGTNNGTAGVDGDGGCMEFDTGSSGNATLTLTNVTIQNCATLQGGGGGIVLFNFLNHNNNGFATISNSIIQGNSAVNNPSSGSGGGIAISNDARMVMTNSQVLNNNATQVIGGQNGQGGGIMIFFPFGTFAGNPQTAIHASTISGNKAAGFGGGIQVQSNLLLDQGSVISNNVAGTDGVNPVAGQEGGGIYSNTFDSVGCPASLTCSTTLSKVTITGNSATGNGGGISNGSGSSSGPLAMSFSRLAGNTTGGSGSNLNNNHATATVTNNWWGTNNASSTINSISATTTFDPFIVLTHTASPGLINPSANSTLTGDMSKDNHGSGGNLAGNLDVIVGLPITFDNAVLGTIPEAQPEPLGNPVPQATATYNAGSTSGPGSADATVDQQTVTAKITVTTATHFTISAPASATAGTAFNFTVTALNASDGTATDYTGPVHFTSSDGSATLPADSTLTNGAGTFSATLKTAGTQTISAADAANPTLNGTSNNIAVSPAAATHFAVSAPATATAGTAFNFTVTAQDQFNNTATSYAGTVHFTSSDGVATLPADSTLANGTGTFSATLKTAGNQSITATDTVTASITGTATISVSPAAATHFAVSAPATATAGTAFSFTVAALDQFNNIATGYAGTVHFSSSDGSATLPANSTLSNGLSTFSATLKTAGNQTITATDTVTLSITGTSNTIAVSPAAATHFSITAPAAENTGGTFTFTVTARDQFNNIATAYTGTVHFTSSDGAATLPADSTLTYGVGSFAARVITAGSQSITATDTVTTSITGTVTITVTAPLPPVIATRFIPAGIQPNATTALEFTITNPGANIVPLVGVAFSDTLPTGLTVPGASATVCGGTVTLTPPTGITMVGATIPASGGQCIFSVTVTGTQTGLFTNVTSAVTSTNGGTGNIATAGLAVANPPTISKLFSPNTIAQGGSVALSFTLTNPNSNSIPPNNDVTLTGIGFTDNFPAGLVVGPAGVLNNDCGGILTAVPGGSSIMLTGGAIAPSVGLVARRKTSAPLATNTAAGSCFITVSVQTTTSGNKNNFTGPITANESGPGAGSNTATLTVSPPPQPPTVAKSFNPATVPLNGTTSLTFTFTNPNGGTPLVNVSVSDALPAGLIVANPNALAGTCVTTPLSADVIANPGSSNISMTALSLPGAGSCSFSVNVTGTSLGIKNNVTGNVTATFDDGAGTFIPVTGLSASASATVVAPDMTVTKSHSGNFTQADVGDTYTITVNNAGNAPSSGAVTVTDSLPAFLIPTNIAGTGWACTLASLTCTRSDALNGSSSYPPITLTVSVAVNAPPSVTNSVTVSGGGEVNTSNDTATDPTTINQLPGPPLTISVLVPPTQTIKAGSTATFVFDVVSHSATLGSIGFACSSGVPFGASCAFNPPGESQGEMQVTMTVTTTANTSSALPWGAGRTGPVYAALLFPVAGLLSLAVAGRRGRKSRLRLVLFLGGLLVLTALFGCGGVPHNGTPLGAHAITVSAVSLANSTVTATTQVTVTVQ